MFLRLSDDSEAKLKVFFGMDEKGRRTTTAALTVPAEPCLGCTTFLARTVCSKKDIFSRREGRQVVAQKLLAILRAEGFNKADRKRVFDAICPEFKPKSYGEIEVKGVVFKAYMTEEQSERVQRSLQKITETGRARAERVF